MKMTTFLTTFEQHSVEQLKFLSAHNMKRVKKVLNNGSSFNVYYRHLKTGVISDPWLKKQIYEYE